MPPAGAVAIAPRILRASSAVMLAQYIADILLAMAKYPLWFDDREPLYTMFRMLQMSCNQLF